MSVQLVGTLKGVLESMAASVGKEDAAQSDVEVVQVMVLFRDAHGEEGMLAASGVPESLQRLSLAHTATHLAAKVVSGLAIDHGATAHAAPNLVKG